MTGTDRSTTDAYVTATRSRPRATGWWSRVPARGAPRGDRPPLARARAGAVHGDLYAHSRPLAGADPSRAGAGPERRSRLVGRVREPRPCRVGPSVKAHWARRIRTV